MSDIPQTLADLLKTIRRPGDFFATGKSDIFAPRIEVNGVGPISLPLLPAQARQLIAVAEQAPYGRGPATLVDAEVRRTWQIGAEQVSISGRHWREDLATIVGRCATGLGVLEPVAAELYKMLVYDTGSFFLPHRDTEKEPGMFATLVLAFPADFTGGELSISHREREVILDLSCDDAAEVAFAAFYADCRHEVRPVTSGYRLVLIYNLVRKGSGKPPEPPAYDRETELATAVLQHWSASLSAPVRAADIPEKLIYPLEHVYTPAEISFAGLKNADAAVAAVMVEAARRANCELHLALLTIEESGSAEYSGRGYHRYDDDADQDDFEIGEVFDSTLSLSDWCLPDNSRPALASLPFDEGELCPPDAFDEDEPDEEEFFEATGNAGASFERSYRRAALVLWPRERKLDILAGGGLKVSLPYLADLAGRWAESGEALSSPLWLEAHRLAESVIARWPERGGPAQAGWRPAALSSLTQLRDTEAIGAFLSDVSARGGYGVEDNEALATAIGLLPAERAAVFLKNIVACNAPCKAAACADLLDRVTRHGLCGQDAADVLVAALPGDPALAPKFDVWRRVEPLSPELVSQVLALLCRLDAVSLGERAVDQFLAWPAAYPLDTILVPAALQLAEGAEALRSWPPALRLRGACLAHLDARIALPLAPPADFTRPGKIACNCQYCLELANFLASADRKQWIFKAAQASRSHVESSIRQHHCDLDTQTLTHSRPHELVCTKNQSSYERRVVQRKRDLAERERLFSAG